MGLDPREGVEGGARAAMSLREIGCVSSASTRLLPTRRPRSLRLRRSSHQRLSRRRHQLRRLHLRLPRLLRLRRRQVSVEQGPEQGRRVGPVRVRARAAESAQGLVQAPGVELARVPVVVRVRIIRPHQRSFFFLRFLLRNQFAAITSSRISMSMSEETRSCSVSTRRGMAVTTGNCAMCCWR